MTRIVLGIETSCDETAVAIVDDDKRILSNIVLSQHEHAATGGVVPEVAARAHLDQLDSMIAKALKEAGMGFDGLDAIAVTAGPGLIGGVLVGAVTAKAIAAVRGLPLIAVNHLEGHALTVRLTHDVDFPYLLLLASGGHCQLLVVEGVGQYRRLGTTIDDAVGEAFDKTAKMLGLGYPGGPEIERLAATCIDHARALRLFPLPKPLIKQAGCDFSFSGLKTAVRRAIETMPEHAGKADLCFAFQETVAAIVRDRVGHAIDMYVSLFPLQTGTLVTAGGVAANARLRTEMEGLAQRHHLRFVAPPSALCTDNAAMIAWAGVERLRLGWTDPDDFPVRPRWPLDPAVSSARAR